MSRYKAYSEYKDSGVEWFQHIPSHWSLAPMRRSLLEHKQGYYTTDEYVDEGVKLLRITDLRDFGNVDFSNCPKVPSTDVSLLSFELKNGDVVFARTGGAGSFGVIQGLNERAVFASYLIRFRFREEKFVNEYLKFTLGADSFQKAVKQNIHGGVNQNIHAEDIKNAYLAQPPLSEQQKIANFLDYETAKIDTLVAKQQELIKLLKEKRQAVISHAVTKGLNPNAPMRDSGVEWLGEVPEHWEVTRLKHRTILFEQGWSPQCDSRPAEAGEFGVLKVGCVNYGQFNSTENKALPIELMPQLQYLIKKNDLLISRANTKELVGSAAVIKGDFDNLILCDKLYRLRFESNVEPQWVSFYLSLPIVRQQIELEASGASQSMQNIGQSSIKELCIVLPPHDEAIDIIKVIEEKTNVFEICLIRAARQIELLQERRTALISAAVTGKIDVRDWQAPSDTALAA